jgi:hypothetical protein
VAGFGLSAVIGLVLGYYILCYIMPEGNFLGLPPGMFPWKIETPAAQPEHTSGGGPTRGR